MNTPKLKREAPANFPLAEVDIESHSIAGRQIWTRAKLQEQFLPGQISGAKNSETWLRGLALLGRTNCHQQTLVPQVFANYHGLIFVTKGRQSHWLEGRQYLLKSGDCMLLRPRQQHRLDTTERGCFYWWLFDPRKGLLGLDKQRSALLLEAIICRFCTSKQEPQAACHMAPKQAIEMRHILGSLFREWECRPKPASGPANEKLNEPPDKMENMLRPLVWEHELLNLFFLILQNEFLANNTKTANDSNSYLPKICGYISKYIYRNISLAELRRLTPYSEPHLLRLFREQYGLSLRDYINREKIYKAQELLHKGSYVTQVAVELGFSSSQYFAVVFRRYAGISPTAWRQRKI